MKLRSKPHGRLAGLLAITAFAGASLGVAGCGGDPSTASVENAKPPLTIPNESVTPGDGGGDSATSATGSTGGGDTGGGDTGGSTPDNSGGGDTGGTNTDTDTGGNNTGTGNGGQQYDQFCQENPGACGD